MRKLLIVALMLVASGSAYSGGKEYSVYNCEKQGDAETCDGCELITGLKSVSFKVSKSLGSIMSTYTLNDNRIKSRTINNCKVFDDESVDCETIDKSVFIDKNSIYVKRLYKFILANGKWSSIQEMDPDFFNGKKIDHPTLSSCGTEIKSILNFFK